MHKHVTQFLPPPCTFLCYLHIVSHYINPLSYPTSGANNIHGLPLHSLFCMRFQTANNFMLVQHGGSLDLLPQVESLKYSTNKNIMSCNARLSYSAFSTPNRIDFYSKYLFFLFLKNSRKRSLQKLLICFYRHVEAALSHVFCTYLVPSALNRQHFGRKIFFQTILFYQ